jgi:hypothetical protein
MKWWTPLAVLIVLIAAFAISYTLPSEPASEPEGSEETLAADGVLPQKITSSGLDKNYSFAGEFLPLENFDVRERLDRELTVNSYYHSSTLLLLKRAKRYFDIMDPILKEEGVPKDFKYVAVAESALSNATSPAGAKGFWQFMERTGEHYGLEVNRDIDERFHLEKATRAACQLIKDYYERFGSWSLAAMAYNGGETRIARSLREQKAEHFYELNLNEETMRYLFRIIALKEIMSQPDKFGYLIEEKDQYSELPAYKVLKVDTTIADLGAFAEAQQISYRMLKVYNPWMLTGRLPNRSGKLYEIKVPFPE